MYNNSNIRFGGGSVPIAEVARIMKKDKNFVRVGIQEGWLPIGVAYKKKGATDFNYYVSPKKLYEFTGYVYEELII